MAEQAVLRRSTSFNDVTTRGASKMWSVHLLDIEALAHGARTHEALRMAVQIPHVCAALCDAHLRSSYQRYQTWCEQWLEPVRIDDEDIFVPFEELYAAFERLSAADALSPTSVPLKALKELQLKRLVRSPVSRVLQEPAIADPRELRVRQTSLFLSAAAWHWYTEFASVDTTVQTNLSRLAVMR